MKMLRLFALLLVSVMLMNLLVGCNTCDHQWEAANCKDPKTCRLCGKTKGDTNDKHQWEDATTDAPKTCSVCGLTEGEKIDVDERFTTDACKEVFGNWVGLYEQDGTRVGRGGELMIPTKLTITFFNNGNVRIVTSLEDPAAFKQEYASFMLAAFYKDFENRGLSRADAEAWSIETHGKELVAYCVDRTVQIAAALESTEDMVYYVDDGVIYIAEDWDSDMSASSYELTDDTMLLDYSELGQELEMSRVGTEK